MRNLQCLVKVCFNYNKEGVFFFYSFAFYLKNCLSIVFPFQPIVAKISVNTQSHFYCYCLPSVFPETEPAYSSVPCSPLAIIFQYIKNVTLFIKNYQKNSAFFLFLSPTQADRVYDSKKCCYTCK